MGEQADRTVTPLDWHLCGAGIGGVFCGASALLSYWLALKLLKSGPAGPLAAMVSGLVLRSAIGLGGPALAFTLLRGWSAEPSDKMAYWVWVLAAYLLSLMVELPLLVRRLPKAKPVETGKG